MVESKRAGNIRSAQQAAERIARICDRVVALLTEIEGAVNRHGPSLAATVSVTHPRANVPRQRAAMPAAVAVGGPGEDGFEEF